jgi:ParB-like chromosome segregation protein Spo0J
MNQGMIVQKIPVSEINPAKYNPRKDLKPGDPAYEKLKRSMTEFGYVEPIIWNEETGVFKFLGNINNQSQIVLY